MRHFNQSQRSGCSLRPRRMAGLSLIELMIALALGLLILTGLVTVFVNSSAARNEVERTSRQIENGRFAIEILSDDLRLAGFYDGLSLVASSLGITEPTTLPDPCFVPTNREQWLQPLFFHVQGYSGSNGASCILASHNYKSGTDVLVARRVATCAAGSTGCDTVSEAPYLQVSRCASQIPVANTYVKVGLEGTETFDLKLLGATATTCSATNAAVRQYFVNIYFVSTTNGINGSGDPIPTLKRLEFTGAGWTETALVEGIEHLKIEYGMDTTGGDGLPDVYASNPSEYPDTSCDDACKVNNWKNVMTARFYVLARNIEASPGFTDTKTYQLGSVSVAAANDGYRRHVYRSLVRIANPAGLRDAP